MVANPHRAQISHFVLFELILLLKLKQFPVNQFEATVSQSTVPDPHSSPASGRGRDKQGMGISKKGHKFPRGEEACFSTGLLLWRSVFFLFKQNNGMHNILCHITGVCETSTPPDKTGWKFSSDKPQNLWLDCSLYFRVAWPRLRRKDCFCSQTLVCPQHSKLC